VTVVIRFGVRIDHEGPKGILFSLMNGVAGIIVHVALDSGIQGGDGFVVFIQGKDKGELFFVFMHVLEWITSDGCEVFGADFKPPVVIQVGHDWVSISHKRDKKSD
jgi:hypothetical protein